MSSQAHGTAFLEQFKEFLAFLRNLWGILAGISVFFPLSNVLAKVIPLQSLDHDGAFAKLSPALVTTLATIATLFVVLATFGRRSEAKARARGPSIRRRAGLSFGLGVACLVLYLIGYSVKLAYAYDAWGWESQDPRHLIAEVPLLVAYVAAFALITRAFVMLGMIEFFSGKAHT